MPDDVTVDNSEDQPAGAAIVAPTVVVIPPADSSEPDDSGELERLRAENEDLKSRMAALEAAQGQRKVSLRRSQIALAEKGNLGALIWLGKQLLGQKDQHVIEHKDEERPDFSQCTTEELATLRAAARS